MQGIKASINVFLTLINHKIILAIEKLNSNICRPITLDLKEKSGDIGNF